MQMVNFTHVLFCEFRYACPQSSMLDLNAYFRDAKCFDETIKVLLETHKPNLLVEIFGNIALLGSFYNINLHSTSYFAIISECTDW